MLVDLLILVLVLALLLWLVSLLPIGGNGQRILQIVIVIVAIIYVVRLGGL